MESAIVHEQLNKPNNPGARNILICYLQYLMDYRRDVAEMDEHVKDELHRLQLTEYVKQLQKHDPIYGILQTAEGLETADGLDSKSIWSSLNRNIPNLT